MHEYCVWLVITTRKRTLHKQISDAHPSDELLQAIAAAKSPRAISTLLQFFGVFDPETDEDKALLNIVTEDLHVALGGRVSGTLCFMRRE